MDKLELYADIIPTSLSTQPGGNRYVLQIPVDDETLAKLGTSFMISNKLKLNILVDGQ